MLRFLLLLRKHDRHGVIGEFDCLRSIALLVLAWRKFPLADERVGDGPNQVTSIGFDATAFGCDTIGLTVPRRGQVTVSVAAVGYRHRAFCWPNTSRHGFVGEFNFRQIYASNIVPTLVGKCPLADQRIGPPAS